MTTGNTGDVSAFAINSGTGALAAVGARVLADMNSTSVVTTGKIQ